MKLASLNRGRDGQLIVVNKALTHATLVSEIAPTLQYALDNWQVLSPKLVNVFNQLNNNQIASQFEFDINDCASPLPRAFQWADGSAYVNHVELVRKARGAEMPASFWTDPLVYQGMSDGFYSPTADIEIADINWGVDFEGEIAVITDDVPMAVNANDAADHIKLLMLVNDVSLRNLIPGELGKGFGFFQSKPASAFSAIAVTPDELDDSWQDNKVHLPLNVWLNEQKFGQPNAGIDMTFDFSQLVEHVAKSRHLAAGTIIGSGTVSNRDRSAGSCCIAEVRMIETIEEGAPKTPFMQYGDRVKIDMFDKSGESIFGAIEQQVVPYQAQSK